MTFFELIVFIATLGMNGINWDEWDYPECHSYPIYPTDHIYPVIKKWYLHITHYSIKI